MRLDVLLKGINILEKIGDLANVAERMGHRLRMFVAR